MERLETTCLLSIITVCFNERQRIELTCQSVVRQTYQDFEWIVIDGGSTDGTLDILQRYSSRMTHFVSEPDRGIYHAMNKGIVLAQGRYLLFLNGGDYLYESETLSRIFPAAIALEKDVYYGDVLTERADGYRIRSFDFTNPYKMLARRSLPHQATFIKRALFDAYGLHDESLKIAADLEFFLRVFISSPHRKHHTIEHLPVTVSVYENIHGISSRNIADCKAELRCARQKHYPALYLHIFQARRWYTRHYHRWMPPIKNAIKQIILRKTPCRKSA